MNSVVGGITTNLMIGNSKDLNRTRGNIFLVIFQWQATTGFFNDVSVTFNDKTDPSDPLQRED